MKQWRRALLEGKAENRLHNNDMRCCTSEKWGPRGAYKGRENNKGPKTDPWGTPN